MEIKILFFGPLAELSGKTSIMLENIPDTDALLHQLMKQYPAISGRPYLVAVEKDIIESNTPLKHGDTVALLPPFAGG
jgi:molybdopterin synthase sulfur carrier subunit